MFDATTGIFRVEQLNRTLSYVINNEMPTCGFYKFFGFL